MSPDYINILAISTTLLNEKVYVKGFSIKTNGKLIPNYTYKADCAHDFISDENANSHIDRIVNPNNRKFTKETLCVKNENKMI